MTASSLPALILWPDSALYAGPGFDADMHRHHALQICMALEHPLRYRSRRECAWLTSQAVAIDADQSHELQCSGQVLVLFVAPESDLQKLLVARLLAGKQARLAGFAPDIATATGLLNTFAQTQDKPCAAACGLRDLFCDQEQISQKRNGDERIERVIASIQQQLEAKISVANLAAQVALSADHLMKLFRQTTGLSVRQYILWSRIQRATQAVVGGMSLTDAAMEAGFSDSAHFSKSFRATFGLAPSLLNLIGKQGRFLICQDA